jgi:PilZ domain-containing protein
VSADRGDRRWHRRLPLRLPVLIQGRHPDGSVFDELAACEDVSDGGVRLHLRHPVRQGQLLHLSLPLPSHFRQYDLTHRLYRVYALVRSVVPSGEEGARVGLLFYGKTPPQGEESLPTGPFFIAAEAGETGLRRHHGVPLMLRLPAEHAPGALERGERALAECIRMWAARVRICSLPAMKGALVLVEDSSGDFRTRAEVRHIVIGADGAPRLDLAFLDSPAPGHLLTVGEVSQEALREARTPST